MPGGEQFTNAATRWSKFEEKSGPLSAVIVDMAKHFDKSAAHDDATKRKTIQQLQKSLQQLVKLENLANARRDASQRTAQKVSADTSANALEVFKGESNRATQSAARTRVNRDARVKKIAQLLGDEEEDEVQAVGEEIRSTCPILATALIHPMKNGLCGHVYSYQGAFQLLMQKIGPNSNYTTLDQIPPNITVVCPVAGCNKKIGPNSLKRDYAAEHSQRVRTATARNEDEDDAIDMIN